MRSYKGYDYYSKQNGFGRVYYLLNEKDEIESEFLDLDELKEAVDNRIEYGYWNY